MSATYFSTPDQKAAGFWGWAEVEHLVSPSLFSIHFGVSFSVPHVSGGGSHAAYPHRLPLQADQGRWCGEHNEKTTENRI